MDDFSPLLVVTISTRRSPGGFGFKALRKAVKKAAQKKAKKRKDR